MSSLTIYNYAYFLSLFSYNVTEDILPFVTYGFQVSLCNDIGCGRFTEAVIVMTAQDGKSFGFGQTILCTI